MGYTATAAEALEKRGKLFFTYGKGGRKGSMGNVDGTELSHVNPVMQIPVPREQSSKHGGTTPPKLAAQTMGKKNSPRKKRKKKKHQTHGDRNYKVKKTTKVRTGARHQPLLFKLARAMS